MKYADHVIIRNQVFRWEEKAPFVPSGKSVLGAIEYDREADKVKCHECGQYYASLADHLKSHGVTTKDYRHSNGLTNSSSLRSPSLRNKRSLVHGPILRSARSKRFPYNWNRSLAKAVKQTRSTAETKNLQAKCRMQLLARVRIIAEDLGRIPMATEMKGIANSARREFGSLSNFLQEAGLSTINGHAGGHGGSLPGRKGLIIWPKEVLIELLRDFYVLNIRIPRQRDYRSGSLPSRLTFIRRFGTMGEAFNAAGLSKEYEKAYPRSEAA